jgi:hypothetical protein
MPAAQAAERFHMEGDRVNGERCETVTGWPAMPRWCPRTGTQEYAAGGVVTDRRKTLEIDGPTAVCGHCRFTVGLTGKFSVEDGLLVWRAAPDLQPGRGPDLDSCCESDAVVEFERITVNGKDLDAGQITALRATSSQEDPSGQFEDAAVFTERGYAWKQVAP